MSVLMCNISFKCYFIVNNTLTISELRATDWPPSPLKPKANAQFTTYKSAVDRLNVTVPRG